MRCWLKGVKGVTRAEQRLELVSSSYTGGFAVDSLCLRFRGLWLLGFARSLGVQGFGGFGGVGFRVHGLSRNWREGVGVVRLGLRP